MVPSDASFYLLTAPDSCLILIFILRLAKIVKAFLTLKKQQKIRSSKCLEYGCFGELKLSSAEKYKPYQAVPYFDPDIICCPEAEMSTNNPVIQSNAWRAVDFRRCSFGACWQHPGYE